MTTPTDKPPYRVPMMDEIRAIPPNGLTVASTFSGAGGSCTGYRMAGYRVVWANEFVPAAQESYKANADPSCILDPRDVRTVTADDILTATGLARGFHFFQIFLQNGHDILANFIKLHFLGILFRIFA
jgi:DNA (cytosine-5)-methyltransferase 1